jgi:hypothetical protein
VKLRGIIEDDKAFLFSKFQKKEIFFGESYELLKILCQIWYFGHISFV